MEDNHRVAFPKMDKQKKKGKGGRDKSQAEEACEESNVFWIFSVVIVLGLGFAGISAALKSNPAPKEYYKPIHLRDDPVATPTPRREVRGYSLSY